MSGTAPRRGRTRPILAVAGLLVMATAAEAGDPASEFGRAASQAMDAMMMRMHVRLTGDADRDFVTMMVPHHQGAIDMAIAELRYGKNSQLKRIAQEIIVDQQQEIAAMDSAVGAPLPRARPAPTQQPGTQDKEQ
jgi:uncharacterized protein (DUF305 family)